MGTGSKVTTYLIHAANTGIVHDFLLYSHSVWSGARRTCRAYVPVYIYRIALQFFSVQTWGELSTPTDRHPLLTGAWCGGRRGVHGGRRQGLVVPSGDPSGRCVSSACAAGRRELAAGDKGGPQPHELLRRERHRWHRRRRARAGSHSAAGLAS